MVLNGLTKEREKMNLTPKLSDIILRHMYDKESHMQYSKGPLNLDTKVFVSLRAYSELRSEEGRNPLCTDSRGGPHEFAGKPLFVVSNLKSTTGFFVTVEPQELADKIHTQ